MHKGRATGVLIAGFGFGASVMSVASTAIINPENKSPDIVIQNGQATDYLFSESIATKVPLMMHWIALILLVVAICGILLLGGGKTRHSKVTNREVPVKPHLKSASFWLLALVCFCSISAGLYISTIFKNFGDLEIHDDAFLAVTGSVASLCSAFSGLFWGYLMDATSFRTSYILLLLTQVSMMMTLNWIVSFKWGFLVCITALMCCQTGHYLLFGTLFGVIYGVELGAKLYGIFFFTIGFSGLAGFAVQYIVVEAVGYTTMFILFTGLTVVSLFIMFKFNPERARDKDSNPLMNELALSTSKSEVHAWRLLDV